MYIINARRVMFFEWSMLEFGRIGNRKRKDRTDLSAYHLPSLHDGMFYISFVYSFFTYITVR